jgi:outer membrane murein-binding lipoprotein Lpp
MSRRIIPTLSIAAALLGAASLSGCVESGSTQSDSMAAAPLSAEVRSLEGMRARNLDSEMNRLGFRNVGGYKTDDASITTWWNPNGEQCVNVTTRDGRVAATESIFAGNCK